MKQSDQKPTQSVHDGHRQRMRQRVLKNGASSLQQHEILEFLLYPFIPRRDTNVIAHALIDQFGNLAGVLNAAPQRLADVKGMTESAAIYLTSLPDVFRIYLDLTSVSPDKTVGRGDVRVVLGNKLLGYSDEVVCVAAIDSHGKVLGCELLSMGKADSVSLTVRQVVDFALRLHATGIALAHNHPSGEVAPSAQDIQLTYDIFCTLEGIGVKLQDHYIFSGVNYYSFDEMGKLGSMILHKQNLKEGINYYD